MIIRIMTVPYFRYIYYVDMDHYGFTEETVMSSDVVPLDHR